MRKLVFIALINFIFCLCVSAQTTAFTYQGRLLEAGVPVTANYDFEFRLYDAGTAGNQLPAGTPVTITKSAVPVSNGVFSVVLDFGTQFPGANRFLDITAKKSADPTFTQLTPRQQVTSSPYSIRTLSAAAADTATAAGSATNFTGSLAGDVTGTQGATVVSTVGTVTAANVASGANLANAATSANTANTIVKRDASGNFAAGTITGNLTGNASTATSGGSTASNYVFAYDTTTRFAVGGSSFQNVIFNTDAQLNGWGHSAGSSSFTCPQTGLYLIQYTAAALFGGGAVSTDTISLRAVSNGLEVAGSQSAIRPVSNNVLLTTLISKSFIASMTIGDTLTLQFTTSTPGGGQLVPIGDGTTKPSVSLTIVKIQ